jgi:serine/threonine protein kinase
MSRIASKVTLATIGDYQILKVLASGTSATVYQGQHPSTGAMVALKVIPGRVVADPVLRMRFAKECQVARKLDHPHVVRVLNFGLDGTKPYLVMEYMGGGSLGQRLQQHGRLAEREAVTIVTQIGQALQWAHERRLVHRDVKPGNILLGEDGQAKLADLGLVKNLDDRDHLTKPLECLGTPNFMAPEQFKDTKKADSLCDLYSLAATLYMTVTGTLPFQARSASAVAAIFKKKLEEDIAPPQQLAPELSERVSVAILRALKVDRKKRQASVQEFIESLAGPSALNREPVALLENNQDTSDEKRANKRYAVNQAGTCLPLQKPCNRPWVGQVVNISRVGLCLVLNRRFERGAMISVEVDARPSAHSVIACVAWVKQVGPGSWKLGCRLAQNLSELEIQNLGWIRDKSSAVDAARPIGISQTDEATRSASPSA